MANNSSIRAFKCPTCGAALEPQTGALTMKCNYCGGTVIIPQSLRISTPRAMRQTEKISINYAISRGKSIWKTKN